MKKELVPSKAEGFTIIELLVTIGIVLLLSGGVVAAFNNFNESQRVKQSAITLKSNLRYSQNKAISGSKPTSGCTTLGGYRVSFTASTYSMQAVCDGALVGDATSVTLPSGVTFNPIPSPFTFTVLTGRISQDTTITVTGVGTTYAVLVTGSGNVSTVGF